MDPTTCADFPAPTSLAPMVRTSTAGNSQPSSHPSCKTRRYKRTERFGQSDSPAEQAPCMSMPSVLKLRAACQRITFPQRIAAVLIAPIAGGTPAPRRSNWQPRSDNLSRLDGQVAYSQEPVPCGTGSSGRDGSSLRKNEPTCETSGTSTAKGMPVAPPVP